MSSEIEHVRAALDDLDYFSDLYQKILCQPTAGLSYARLRFSEVLEVLPRLLKIIDSTSNTLAWSWPKGRALIGAQKEDSLTTAKREFAEEVEVVLPSPLILSDQFITEEYTTIGGKLINSYYWLYVVANEFTIPILDKHPEVRKRGWYTLSESKKLLSNNLYEDAATFIAQHLSNDH